MMKHQAMFWHYNDVTKKVECELCPHNCVISEGKLGLCKTRENISGELIANNYGKVTSIALDPIEKKPLYHYKPGKNILSLGTYGCNMRCQFCQNYEISQNVCETKVYTIDDILNILSQIENNIGLAFTYNEPFMWYEFVIDVATKIKKVYPDKDIILVTNGYINQEPLVKLLPFIDAMNIDLKTYSDDTYHRLCGASLEPVLQTIKMASTRCHVEVTTLIVPEENDSLDEIKKIAKFLRDINPNIVLHLSRYFPRFQMDKAPTKKEMMEKALIEARKYLPYVYAGNLEMVDSNTYCPQCHKVLVERHVYQVKSNLQEPLCPFCHYKVPFVI
jgi:pyruvate formate lyase activating enzyme